MKTNISKNAWQSLVRKELPLLGHRNWIVIADAAYPRHTSPGIETVSTGADQLEVVRFVLQAVTDAGHVRPLVMVDAELADLPEKDAPGIEAYRTKLGKLFAGEKVNAVPHEQIITKLDEASHTFCVLLLKTTLKLPYTSVFLQLDCGYWSAEAEKRLRRKRT